MGINHPSGGQATDLARTVEMNEEAIRGPVRQQELTDTVEQLNAQLREEIARRQLAEDALRASDERLRTLADTIPQLAWTADSDGSIHWYNRRWYEYTGTLPEEMDGWGWQKVHDPAALPRVLDRWRASIASGEPFEMVFPLRGADGQFHPFLTRVQPMKDPEGRVTQWFGTNTDIEALMLAEDALRASEAFNRSVIDSSPDCIKVLDLEGNLLSMEAGQELLGIKDIQPLLHKPWIDFWGPEDRLAAQAAIQVAVRGGEGHFVGFFRTFRNEDKWWDVAISPILEATGQPARLLVVSRDVTQRRELENSLVARAEDLVQADRSKDEFLAMLAHELRNPLAPLRNAAEIMKLETASADDRAQAQRIIVRQIENMSRMIDDLLDVSRITEGKIELRKKPVMLEAILTAAASLARSNFAAHHQELEVSMPSEPIFLNGDATRLEQVFSNLLGNACKYSGEGCHIQLTAERAADVEPPEVIVRVRDDGAGIDPELLPRIFDLFVQATRSLDREHGGLGIGLTLVSRLVKLHGGSVEARSDGLGLGSEFIVHLPILRKAPPSPAPAPPVAPEISRRILIVDDNSDSARSMAILQTRRGHVTHTAFTGPDAVTAAAEFLPEVVLLDIGLPGMDGFEVARRLREMPALAGAFLIAMTGYATMEDHIAARQAGFDEHLVKPVDLDILREWLRTRVSQAR